MQNQNTDFELRGVDFRDHTAAEVVAIFEGIPATTTHLTLDDSHLGDLDGEVLVQAFTAIPATVTHISLVGNHLNRMNETGFALRHIFAAISPTVTNINLGDNHLGLIPGAQLAQIFAAIPPSVTTLGLVFNNLDNILGNQLAQALAAIPPTVTDISLAGNHFGDVEGAGALLVTSLAALSPTVTRLTLWNNNLANIPVDALVALFAAIPPSVTTLGLDSNGFANMPGDQLVQILRAIRPTVTNLSFFRNGLQNRSIGESSALDNLFAIPQKLRCLQAITVGNDKAAGIKAETLYSQSTGNTEVMKKSEWFDLHEDLLFRIGTFLTFRDAVQIQRSAYINTNVTASQQSAVDGSQAKSKDATFDISSINPENVNDLDQEGYTALMYCLEYGEYDKAHYLIVDMGADVNRVNNLGNSPLHIVLEHYRDTPKCQAIIKLLLDSGANINLPNNDNNTPLDLAGLKDCQHLLTGAGTSASAASKFKS